MIDYIATWFITGVKVGLGAIALSAGILFVIVIIAKLIQYINRMNEVVE